MKRFCLRQIVVLGVVACMWAVFAGYRGDGLDLMLNKADPILSKSMLGMTYEKALKNQRAFQSKVNQSYSVAMELGELQ